MKLTLALTVYNRYEMLLESFAQVIDDDRIDEVLIMDDASEPEYWNKIKELPKFNPKIKVVRQLTNQGMSRNKRDAIFNSKNEWVIIFDSDNVIGKDYLDALEVQMKIDLGKEMSAPIYCPSFAKPNFDFRRFADSSYDLFNKPDLSTPEINILFNCCNYVVHKQSYLIVWQENKSIKGTDTIWLNYLWLKHGHHFRVVKGMEYFHRVHPESGFLKDASFNMKKAEEIKKLIMNL